MKWAHFTELLESSPETNRVTCVSKYRVCSDKQHPNPRPGTHLNTTWDGPQAQTGLEEAPFQFRRPGWQDTTAEPETIYIPQFQSR